MARTNSQSISKIGDDEKTSNGTITTLSRVENLQTGAEFIGDGKVSEQAQRILDFDADATIWQDSPSPALLIWPAIEYFLIFLLALFLTAFGTPRGEKLTQVENELSSVHAQLSVKENRNNKQLISELKAKEKQILETNKKLQEDKKSPFNFLFDYAPHVVFAWALWSLFSSWIGYKKTTYRVTNQRLIIETGVLSKSSSAYELHKLQQSHIDAPLLLRMFGTANLYLSGLWLVGIRNAEAVRDLVRNAGQIEASRIDKARWR